MQNIVDFKNTATPEQIAEWLVSNQITSHSILDAAELIYLVDSTSAPALSDIVESITENVSISNQLLGAVEIIPLTATTQASFNHDGDWWKTASCLNIDFNNEETTFDVRGQIANVYMLDSGINKDHPEFVGANVVDLFTFTGSPEDNLGHGTALASIIVGKTCGITNSTMKNVKIFDANQTTMLSDIVQAMDAVFVDVVANSNKPSIVNMSWSIPKNTYVESKIQQLIDAGAMIVVAAGNSGVAIEDVTPASMENVLTVGAYDDNFVPANFSNYTSDVPTTQGESNHGALDVWAPGVNIKAARLDGMVGNIAGTSAASAVMAACCAYNSDMGCTKDGATHKTSIIVEMFSKMKRDMLVLSGKYAASVNRICTFIPHAVPNFEFGSYSFTNILYPTNNAVFLARNTMVEKVELSIDLPEGLTLSNGWIVGDLTNPPAEMQVLQFTASVTYLSGTVNTSPVKLFVMPAGSVHGDMPADATLLEYCNGNGTTGCSGLCEAACENCGKGTPCPGCGDLCV